MQIKIINQSQHPLPNYETIASGYGFTCQSQRTNHFKTA